MISLHKSLKQMAWADEKLFNALLPLAEEAWRSQLANDDWNVAAHTFHLIASADWYSFCLGGQIRISQEPTSIDEIKTLGSTWRDTNEFLINQSLNEDEKLTYEDEGQEVSALRSTILSQAVIHSAEHRTYISWALRNSGFEFPPLEDFSVWAYEASVN